LHCHPTSVVRRGLIQLMKTAAPGVGKLGLLRHPAPHRRQWAFPRCHFRRPVWSDSSEAGFVQVTELMKDKGRVKAVRAMRRSTDLEGSSSTAATRADQVVYARGYITATGLGDRVRRRSNVQQRSRPRIPGTPETSNGTGRLLHPSRARFEDSPASSP